MAELDSSRRTAPVAVVMLTVNQCATTVRALESFDPADLELVNILVWDNGSTDDTVATLKDRFPHVHVHAHSTNLGVASGRNAAAELAIDLFRPEYLLFLDNDLVFTERFVASLLAAFEDPSLGQVQAKLRSLRNPELINDGGGCEISFWRGRTRPVGFDQVDRGQFDTPQPCVSCGGAMMVRTDVFRELDGFDSLFDPFGPEDLDFSLRLQGAGYRAMYIPAAMAYHEVGSTFGGGQYTAQYARVKAQHWLRFLGRHGSPVQKVCFYLFGAPLIALRMAVREGRKGNIGALLGSARGMLRGLRRPGSAGG